MAQMELATDVVFKRTAPLQVWFRRACELGILVGGAQRTTHLFGRQITRHYRGKLQTVLDQREAGHPVLRWYYHYASELLQAFDTAQRKPPAHEGFVEPLSERELDVLRLLGTDLSGPEIAGHLTVSLSTVRTHTQNVFNKLGVNNRRAAVRRAEELGLLSHAGKA